MKTESTTLAPLLTVLQESFPPDQSILSVYLDTGPGRTDGPAYLFAFRDGCKALRLGVSASEREVLESAIAQAEQYLTSQFTPGKPGLALFASGQADYLRAVDLPAAPGDEVRWDNQPHLAPLYALLGEYERIAAVVIDKEHARLFTVYMGHIEEQREIRDWVSGKQATGGWYALAQTHYARRHEEQVLRHVRHTVTALLSMYHAHPFDRLLLGGSEEALAVLRHHLPQSLRSRLAGTLSLEIFASDAKVLDAVLQAEAELGRQAELADVRELLAAATAPFAVVGLDETLAVLGEGRVQRLILADGFSRPGGTCPKCDRLSAEEERCPICDTPLVAVADLAPRAIAGARDQGAQVTVVTGLASAQFMEHEGIGAWLRY